MGQRVQTRLMTISLVCRHHSRHAMVRTALYLPLTITTERRGVLHSSSGPWDYSKSFPHPRYSGLGLTLLRHGLLVGSGLAPLLGCSPSSDISRRSPRSQSAEKTKVVEEKDGWV